MTIISISKSSTPHRYNKSPAAAVATTRLGAQLKSSDKKLQLETQCPASSFDASCSNASPQISSTASTTILVRPQLQQRHYTADQQQQQLLTSSSSSSSTDKRFTKRRSRVISSFGATTEFLEISQSFLKLERSLSKRGAATSKFRNSIASGNLFLCNLSNYCRISIGEAVAPGLTVVAACTKQHMAVKQEDDQEEEVLHCTVETPPVTSGPRLLLPSCCKIKDHVLLLFRNSTTSRCSNIFISCQQQQQDEEDEERLLDPVKNQVRENFEEAMGVLLEREGFIYYKLSTIYLQSLKAGCKIAAATTTKDSSSCGSAESSLISTHRSVNWIFKVSITLKTHIQKPAPKSQS